MDEHCINFLQGIWEPLFQYVSSEYGPPRQLNYLDCPEFLSKEATVSAKNWVYDVPEEYDMKGSSVYKYLTSILTNVPGVKPGFTCLLKVSIPARETHPFWKLDPTMEAEYKLFIWDMAEEALEIEVCLWGLDDDHAKFNGTCYAKDIIVTSVHNSIPLSSTRNYYREMSVKYCMRRNRKRSVRCYV